MIDKVSGKITYAVMSFGDSSVWGIAIIQFPGRPCAMTKISTVS